MIEINATQFSEFEIKDTCTVELGSIIWHYLSIAVITQPNQFDYFCCCCCCC